MCTAKPPKPKKVEEKPVQYLRNPFLDNINIGTNTGRNSLRIDLGSSPAASSASRAAPSRSLPMPIEPGVLIPSRAGKRQSQLAGIRTF